MDKKAQYKALLLQIEEAIKSEDVTQAALLTEKAESLKTLIDAENKLAEMKTAQAAMDAVAAEKAKTEEDARIKALVDAQVAEATKGLGVKRPGYTADGEKIIPGLKVGNPFDDVDAHQLALGWMVMKAHYHVSGQRPSVEYVRAMHGRAQEYVKTNGLKTVGYHDKDSAALKSLEQMGAGNLAQPICYHYKADDVVRKAMSLKTDELMGSDVSGYGDEWVPVFYSRELFRLIRNEARIASLFRQVEIAGESLVFPIQTGTVTWYKTPQTDDAAEMVWSNAFITSRISKVATSRMTLTPGKLSAIILWTGELNQESLVPMLPFLQQELVMSGQEVIDDTIINGDETTGATNISDYGNGAISAYWRELVLDGLRHHAIVENSGDNATDVGALTAEDFLTVKQLMGTDGKNALNPNKVVWIPDIATYYKMQALGEVITLDKFGPAFTIDKGVLERIWGSPVVPSDQYNKTNASGYVHNTTSGNTKGSILCVRPDQGIIGFGRRMTIETGRIARADAYEIVAHMAFDFDLATLEAVACGYNITV